MHTLFAERSSHSFHMVTLTLLQAPESENDNNNSRNLLLTTTTTTTTTGSTGNSENSGRIGGAQPPTHRFSRSSFSTKTPFQFSGKLFMQNTFDSRHIEEFLRVELVHEANQENVSLLLLKFPFKVDSNFEFEGDVTIYLLKPNELTPDECTTPPRKMSMNSSRTYNCEPPSRPSTSIFQNCFPTQAVLEAIQENFSYHPHLHPPTNHPRQIRQNGHAHRISLPPPPHPLSSSSSTVGHQHQQQPYKMTPGGQASLVKIELKLLFELQFKYTSFDTSDGNPPFKPPKSQASKLSGSLAVPLKNLLEQAIHSDVQLEVEGIVFPAHMAMLASQSEVFKVMFEANMVEKKTKRVIIRDMSAGAVKEMLNFLYTRDTSKFDHSLDMCIEMLHAAEKYIIADLRAASQRALEQTDLSKLIIDDILGLYLCSRTLNMPQVQVNCLNGLKSKGPFLGASKSFEKFCLEHPEIMPEFFTEFTCL